MMAGVMAKPPVELTEAEWTVIKLVWEAEPSTAPAIHQRLQAQTGWAYSTVRTIMDRMVAKGLLRAEKQGKPTLFRSVLTRDQAQRGELLYALKNAFNGALTPMVQCLLNTPGVSQRQLAELEALIQSRKKQTKR